MQNLYKALATAAAELKNPLADRKNTHFGQKYATLQSVVDTVRPVLAKHGIAVVQEILTPEPGKVTIITRLVHSSGEDHAIPTTWNAGTNIQHLGAAVTYLRRYALCAALNIVGDDDDDAETIVAPTREQRR